MSTAARAPGVRTPSSERSLRSARRRSRGASWHDLLAEPGERFLVDASVLVEPPGVRRRVRRQPRVAGHQIARRVGVPQRLLDKGERDVRRLALWADRKRFAVLDARASKVILELGDGAKEEMRKIPEPREAGAAGDRFELDPCGFQVVSQKDYAAESQSGFVERRIQLERAAIIDLGREQRPP